MIISDIFIFAKKTSDIILKYLSIAIGWLLGLFHTHTLAYRLTQPSTAPCNPFQAFILSVSECE